MITFLIPLHSTPYGSNEGLRNPVISEMTEEGRLAKARSCVRMTAHATSDEDTTTNLASPSCTSMRGPCLRESECRDRCGSAPIWWRFPIKGSFGGDGGGFSEMFLLFVIVWRMKRARGEMKKARVAESNKLWYILSEFDIAIAIVLRISLTGRKKVNVPWKWGSFYNSHK